MSIVNAQFQDWKGNIYHFETSTDMIRGLNENFSTSDHVHDDRYYTEDEIDEMADNLKKCVVDGKNKIANAINDKTNNNQMNKDNTFDELADGIRNIQAGVGNYDPLTYVNGLIEDILIAQDSNPMPKYFSNTTLGYDGGAWSAKKDSWYSYDICNRLDCMGILAGDGNVYLQNYVDSKNYTVGEDDRPASYDANYDGGFPPTTLGSSKNLFHIKKGQYLFCLAGNDDIDKSIDFLNDKFIKISEENKGNGNLKLLYTKFPIRYVALYKSPLTGTISSMTTRKKGTMSVYICENDWLDLSLKFKPYYSGVYILVPTYLYREGGSKTEFIPRQ